MRSNTVAELCYWTEMRKNICCVVHTKAVVFLSLFSINVIPEIGYAYI